MKTIQEHNEEILKFYYSKKKLTNVKCPNCENELQYINENILLTSYPPQKRVKCFSCGYETTIYV